MKLVIALSMSFGIALSCSQQAEAGFDRGNAGDAFSAEFILTARDLVQRMQQSKQSQNIMRQWVDIQRLSGAILTTKVRSETNLQLQGSTVDAVNLPDQSMIVVNRDRWREYRTPLETKARLTLVLHEYLGIMGLQDAQFQITGQVLTFLNVQNYSPGTWWNPLNPVNYASLVLTHAAESCSLGNANFDPSLGGETVILQTTGTCGADARKIVITKVSAMAPPSEQIKGIFHRYEIQVFGPTDSNPSTLEHAIGEFTYEPEWGLCVLPEDGTCQLSGQIEVGDVGLIFWYQRK